MRVRTAPSLTCAVWLAIAGSAYGQQPPDVVHGDLGGNTAMGDWALYYNTVDFTNMLGVGNTASGSYTLAANTSGAFNNASGSQALYSNTTGSENTASGYYALHFNLTGNANTASGKQALLSNTTGSYNTASGMSALVANTTGDANSAFGTAALQGNTSGANNTAAGYLALQANTTGNDNTASGYQALYSNTIGASNTAVGYDALYANRTGHDNTAIGQAALRANRSGSNNIAVGFQSGLNLTIGSNNIDIGSTGVAGEASTIRIGSAQTVTYIAGIVGAKVTGGEVFITPNGQLGTLASAQRYKTAVAPMISDSEKLQRLRPVTFHLKADPHGVLQYGLIAEEVARVYPDLVIRTESGRVDGVRYDELAPILLNEAQLQQKKIANQAAQIRGLKELQLRMEQRVADLMTQMQTTQTDLRNLQTHDQFVAQR